MFTKRTTVALLAGATLALSACGGGDASEPSAARPGVRGSVATATLVRAPAPLLRSTRGGTTHRAKGLA